MAGAAPILSVISGVYGIYSGMQQQKEAKAAADEQERIAQANAAREEAETMEEKRRMKEAAESETAKMRAKAAGSGGQVAGSSMDIFMGTQEDKFRKEIDWLVSSGKSRADIIRRGGALEGSITRNQGRAAFGDSLRGGLGSIGSGFEKWFSK